MSAGIPVKIDDDQVLQGRGPIVFLGPNGAGKTRYGRQVAEWNSADFVSALRNIALPVDVTMQSLKQASQQLKNNLQSRRSQLWVLADEINQLFAKLMAEDSAAAIRFRNEHIAGCGSAPKQTKLMRLQEFWVRLFPGRQIGFEGHHPVARSEYNSAASEYPAQQMSDGEREALYLAGRVLDSDGPIVIVDEPEMHFHSRLGTRFWNDMERLRADCRFVYITHDLSFGLSRGDAKYVVIMPGKPPQLIKLEEGIPTELAEFLLGAASFSIHAKRIVFCEGVEGPSLDQALYTAWYNTRDTAVIPVESSANVVRSAAAFGESQLVAGVVAEGLVDRDYWPEDYLEALPQTVRPLDVHEVENLFCLPNVFLAVAKHLAMSTDDAAAAYTSFLTSIRKRFTGELLAKQVTERVKRRCEHEFLNALSSVRLIGEPQSSAQVLQPSAWGSPFEAIVEEEQKRLTDALNGPPEDINKYFSLARSS